MVLHGDAGTKKRPPFEGVIPSLARRAEEYARRKADEGGDPDRIFDYLEREMGRFAEADRLRGLRWGPARRGGRVPCGWRGVRCRTCSG